MIASAAMPDGAQATEKCSALIASRNISIGLKTAADHAPVWQAETHRAQFWHFSATRLAPLSASSMLVDRHRRNALAVAVAITHAGWCEIRGRQWSLSTGRRGGFLEAGPARRCCWG